MNQNDLCVMVHLDRNVSSDVEQGVIEMLEDLGANMRDAYLAQLIQGIRLSPEHRFPNTVTLIVPSLKDLIGAIKNRARLQDILTHLVGRVMMGAAIIGVDVTHGDPRAHAEAHPLPVEVLEFEAAGLQNLRDVARGFGFEPISAGVKIKQIVAMKISNPLRYRSILIANYRTAQLATQDLKPPVGLEIYVTQLVDDADLESDDAGISGIYAVQIPAATPVKDYAGVALDGFHLTVPVSMLDDFEFSVRNAQGVELVEDEDYIAYSTKLNVDVTRVGDLPNGKFMFRIRNQKIDLNCADVATVIKQVRDLRGESVTIEDRRPAGRDHSITIETSGVIHETYGQRLIVHSLQSLLDVPGRPVYEETDSQVDDSPSCGM